MYDAVADGGGKMGHTADDARRYHLYAEELRCIADLGRTTGTSEQLRAIADEYDRVAASMQAIADSRAKLEKT